MSHTGVDVFDFLLYTIYPVIGIFVVEAISRVIKAPKWIKLWTQAIVSIGFGIYYGANSLCADGCNFWFALSPPKDFPMTAMVMLILAIALIYQGRRAKISPEKSPY
jgi:hypothetical protein